MRNKYIKSFDINTHKQYKKSLLAHLKSAHKYFSVTVSSIVVVQLYMYSALGRNYNNKFALAAKSYQLISQLTARDWINICEGR